jgi:hypothetical protein
LLNQHVTVRTRLVRFQFPDELDDLERHRCQTALGVLWCSPVRGYSVIVIGIVDSESPEQAQIVAQDQLIALLPRLARGTPMVDVAAFDSVDPNGWAVSDEVIRQESRPSEWCK